jgi:hypothetical protein
MWWWQKLDALLAGQKAINATLVSLAAAIVDLEKQEKANMAAVDDLNNAVSTLGQNFVTLDAAIQAEVAALKAALAADNTTAIAAAATNISQVSAKMATDAAALSASVGPAA